jgi:N-methylhydantoinase B
MESGKMNITCQPGGMGACATKDGVNAIRSGIGNTGIQPVERTEETFPFVRIEETSIPTDTGGAGRQAGGNALRRVLRFTDDVELTLVCERAESQPYGLRDGDPGASSEHIYVAPDGTRTRLPSKISTQAEAGSRLIVQTAGGGGYGDPLDRSPEQVAADVREGYVSRETARERHGVVIDPETGELDRAATESRSDEK